MPKLQQGSSTDGGGAKEVPPAIRLDRITDDVYACRACPLRKKCNSPVPGIGMPSARVMILGQAPGYYEGLKGLPLQGYAVKFQFQLLKQIGIPDREIYFTNLVKCFPGKSKTKGDLLPPPAAVSECRHFLEAEIEAVKPEVIVVMGAFAMREIGISGGIHKMSATVQESMYGPAIPILHPAGVMRPKNHREAPEYATQLRYIKTILEGGQTPPEPVFAW